MVRYKLLNYDENFFSTKVEIDTNYIFNAPVELRENVDGILTTFKDLMDEENFQTSKKIIY